MPEIQNLAQMLDQMEKSAGDAERVSLGMVLEAVGRRSFGPMLLPGIVLASPLSGIPGMPTGIGLLLLLTSGQLLLRRQHVWLPRWLVQRSLARDRFCRAIEWLRPAARFIDRLLRPRLPVMVRSVGTCLIAFACSAIAAGLPMMEVIPFSAHVAGVAVTAFGLALIARDGLVALLGFAFTGGIFGTVIPLAL